VPAGCSVAEPGDTTTLATTACAVMVMLEAPDFPSLVAVTVAVPAPLAVTRPAVDTLAIALSLVDHAILRPVSVLPVASLVVAVNCCVAPTIRDALVGVTETVATGVKVTVTVAESF